MIDYRWQWFRARVWVLNTISRILLPGHTLDISAARGGVKVKSE